MLPSACDRPSPRPPRLTAYAASRAVAFSILAGFIASCGGETAEPSKPAAKTPTATSTPEATETASPAPTSADITAAEQAVKKELPDIPLWQGARFTGKAAGATEVCVDRVITKASADAVGGEQTSHVVVSLPGLSTGEPQDGPCAKADENADKAIEASRRFFERTDDDAIALDEAVNAVQDEEAGAVERLARLRTRISKRVSNYLLASGETSIGGNLLVSAATTAREAARAGDVARLAKLRRDIAEARAKLAEEATD